MDSDLPKDYMDEIAPVITEILTEDGYTEQNIKDNMKLMSKYAHKFMLNRENLLKHKKHLRIPLIILMEIKESYPDKNIEITSKDIFEKFGKIYQTRTYKTGNFSLKENYTENLINNTMEIIKQNDFNSLIISNVGSSFSHDNLTFGVLRACFI